MLFPAWRKAHIECVCSFSDLPGGRSKQAGAMLATASDESDINDPTRAAVKSRGCSAPRTESPWQIWCHTAAGGQPRQQHYLTKPDSAGQTDQIATSYRTGGASFARFTCLLDPTVQTPPGRWTLSQRGFLPDVARRCVVMKV